MQPQPVSRPSTAARPRSRPLSARTREQHEREAAERVHARLESERAREVAEQEERERQAERQIEAARVGHAKAVSLVRDRRAKQREELRRLDAHRAEANERQVRAVEALKTSTAAAAAQMRAERRAAVARLAESERQRQAEAAHVREMGGNPYLALRLKDEEARIKRERAETERRMHESRERHERQLAVKLRREACLREQARCEKAAARPLPHLNAPLNGPRTLCDPSAVELG